MNRVMNGVMNKETEKKRKIPLHPLKEKNKKKKNKELGMQFTQPASTS